MTTIPNLDDNQTLADSDEFPLHQGAKARRVRLDELAAFLGVGAGSSASRWTVIDSANYTATPASTSQINMSSTTGMAVMLPVRAQQSGVYRYGVVLALTTNTNIRFLGPPLDTGNSITSLEVGTPDMLEQVELGCPGLFNGSTTTTLLLSIAKSSLRWRMGTAYLVSAGAWSRTITGTGPKVNVLLGGQRAITSDSGNGLLADPAATWQDSVYASMDLTHYSITQDEAIELELTATGGGDANDLNVSLLFVRP